jgi:3-oxoacyl-[acyl-carrier protein] reductase
MDIQGGVAIVTGSATGIGGASARALASRGCNVVINYTRSEAEARETLAACEALGVEALLVQADVANDDDCRSMAKSALDRWGRIDALVNCAGTTRFVSHGDLEGLDAEAFTRTYAVNVIGAFQMTRAVAPAMRDRGQGAVVNISSLAGVMGTGSSIAYAASKGALNTMTLSLARALGPEIRVNAVCPGIVEGRWLQRGLGETAYHATLANQERSTPLARVTTPEDVARAVLWFIEGADLTTGEIMLVDGGSHLGGAPLLGR